MARKRITMDGVPAVEITEAVVTEKGQKGDIFNIGELIAYLFQKEYKPCTINLRLRTVKCYLCWLYTEKIIADDISSKIKLVKVPKDTKEPLTIAEVKRMFKVLDLA